MGNKKPFAFGSSNILNSILDESFFFIILLLKPSIFFLAFLVFYFCWFG